MASSFLVEYKKYEMSIMTLCNWLTTWYLKQSEIIQSKAADVAPPFVEFNFLAI